MFDARTHAGEVSTWMKWWGRRLAGLVLLIPSPAAWAEPNVLHASDGLLRAVPSTAAAHDLLALEDNPAGLLGIQAPIVSLLATLDDQVDQPGYGLFLGLPLGELFVPALSVQWLERSPATGTAARKTTLGGAVGNRTLAVGLSHSWFAAEDGLLDERGFWELGVTGRPGRWLSLALVAHNLGRTSLPGQELPRSWSLGLGLRPFTERLTLTGDVRLSPAVELAGRAALPAGFQEGRIGLRVQPLAGLEVEASLGLDRDGVTTGGLAFGLIQENLGLRSEAMIDDGFRGDFTAGALRLDLSSMKRPPLLPLVRGRGVELVVTRGPSELGSGGLLGRSAPTFAEFMAGLRRLRTDPRVSLVLLRLGNPELPMARLEEVRQELLRLKAAGKRLVVHLEGSGTKGYYLASVADELSMSPGDELLLLGLSATFTYLQTTLERVRVRPDFVRIGKYKSAPDSFTASTMSAEQREVEEMLLQELHGRIVEGIAQARRKRPEEVRQLLDQGPYIAETAKDAGLLDQLRHYSELRRQLHDTGVRFLADYFTEPQFKPSWGEPPRIALIHVNGIISRGRSSTSPLPGTEVAGAQTIVAALEQAAQDRQVRAIVLRIDSPGGSATASELIHHHVAEAAKRKPLVVSMGAVAASGGYYVAAPAAMIFADPSTLTGSIGIFAGKFDISGLLAWLGVGRVTVKQGERADLLSLDRSFTEAERQAIRDRLQDSYALFKRRVAEGRKLTVQQVEEVAQGRVWTGQQAKERKLVDELGGIEEAIAAASDRAGLSPSQEVAVEEVALAGGLLTSLAGLQAASEGPGLLAALLGQDVPGPVPGRLLEELGWLPLLLDQLAPGEPLALMEALVTIR